MSEGIRLRRDKKIPVYNTKVNWDNKRKPFKMWIVKHPEGSDVVKGSVTIVMAEHYGQAIDDYITIWNKENRMKRKIGYPVVQGTADKNFRYKRTVSLPKFHRVKEQEDGGVKFWAESSDGKTVSSLIQSKDFADEMEIRISLPDFERITVRGSKDIMDNLTFEEFLDKTNMHLERQELMRKKREPFPVGERRPSKLGDQDVIEAVSGKKLTQTDLIAMQRATRKKGEISEEDFKRRQEIVRKLNDAKFERDKVAKRKIDATNEQQFKKKSLALGRANDKLEIQKRKFKKEFGVEVVDI